MSKLVHQIHLCIPRLETFSVVRFPTKKGLSGGPAPSKLRNAEDDVVGFERDTLGSFDVPTYTPTTFERVSRLRGFADEFRLSRESSSAESVHRLSTRRAMLVATSYRSIPTTSCGTLLLMAVSLPCSMTSRGLRASWNSLISIWVSLRCVPPPSSISEHTRLGSWFRLFSPFRSVGR